MKQLVLALMVILSAALAGCGGGGSGTISVTVSPTTATVSPGATQQFSAKVNNGSSSDVTWQVNNIEGGNSIVGTISTSGLYTAPAAIPGSGTVTITAVSTQDSTKAGTATVSLANPVTISPSSALVAVNATQQFTAKVTFTTSNTNVTWEVNGTQGGDPTNGTISSSGLYTAPSAVPPNATVTITAVSQADTSKTATATVQVTPPTIVISPTDVTLSAGAQQSFSATVLDNPVKPEWTVQCASQLSGGCGSITSDGVFTAPFAPPPAGTVTVTATMSDRSALPASTTVTINSSPAVLFGTYVFGATTDAISGFSSEAGVISFDGLGSITGGMLDDTGTAGPVTITGGTYKVTSDGHGTAIIQTSSGAIAWQFVTATHSKAFIARLTANGVTGYGTMELQDSSAATAITGPYTLQLAGATTASPAAAFAMVGSVTIGTTASVDYATGTTVGSDTKATSAYTAPAANGRGTLSVTSTFGSQTFTYYAVDSTHLKIVETDGTTLSGGELYQQSAGPFTAASFNERVAFTVQGFSGTTPYAIGGLFNLNGNSGITNRVIDGANQTIFDTQGSYIVNNSATGRTTATWTVGNGTTSKYVLYPRSDGGFVMLEIDGSSVAQGLALQQTIVSPSVFSLAGDLALGGTGYEVSATTPEVFTGTVVISHQGVLAGKLDTANKNGISVGSDLQIGSFTVDTSTGRGVVTTLPTSPTLTGGTLIIYILDTNNALVFESDGQRLATGNIARQF